MSDFNINVDTPKCKKINHFIQSFLLKSIIYNKHGTFKNLTCYTLIILLKMK